MHVSAVFVDRDGVLNEDLPDGVSRWEDFRFIAGALDALTRLARARLPVFVITNQANVGRGKVARSVVEGIHAKLVEAVRGAGGSIAGIYVCFHAPEEGCDCRKPAPGLLLRAAREHGLDLARTAFVGDDLRDLEAAARAGALGVLVRTGKGRAVDSERAAAVFDDLAAFVRAVVKG